MKRQHSPWCERLISFALLMLELGIVARRPTGWIFSTQEPVQLEIAHPAVKWRPNSQEFFGTRWCERKTLETR